MLRYVLKRVLIGIVTLFLLSSATFFLMKATPGSPISGEKIKNAAQRELMMKKYNLDKPLFEQYKIYITHACNEELANIAKDVIIKNIENVETEIMMLTPVFTTQGGPNCVAIQVIKKHEILG